MSRDSTKSGEAPKRAARRLKSLALVGSLARSWQQWANDNTHRQSVGPVGWQPSADKLQNQPLDKEQSKQLLTEHSLEEKDQRPALLLTTCKDLEEAEDGWELGVKIKTKEVAKSVDAKLHECGRDNVNALSNKYKLEVAPGVQSLQGHKTPKRRHHCTSLVVELTRSWKQIEEENEPQLIDKSQGIRNPVKDTEGGGQTAAPRLERGAKSWKREKETGDGDDELLPRIKRAGGSLSLREEIGKDRNLVASKKYNPLMSLKSQWQEWADHHQVKQKLNPFSEEFDYELAMSTRLQKGDQGYGRPKEGTKTAERAHRAEAHIRREMVDMCFIIRSMGRPGADGRVHITFGELFERYVRISDKVVGILMRARKHGYLHFEGEMLWQGRDDGVIITMLQ